MEPPLACETNSIDKSLRLILTGLGPKYVEFVIEIHRVSIYLRWLACSILKEEYEELEKNSDKPYPGATTFFYMWAAIEDAVLEHWCNLLLKKRPKHLSLHFDGVRVSTDIATDMDALILECEQHIREQTGFAVRIREKQHKHFIAHLSSLPSEKLEEVPTELVQAPKLHPMRSLAFDACRRKARMPWKVHAS